jgi:hypothetical protein
MNAELDVLDAAISHALLRTHLSDRVKIIVDAIAEHSSGYTNERLEDIVVYALLEAEKQRAPFNSMLIRRLITEFLNHFDES